jgi:hypothetical protein
MQSQPPARLLHGIQRDRINRLPFRDRLSLHEQNLFFRHYSRRGPSHNHGSSDLHVFWGSFTLDSRILPFEFSSTSPWGKAGWFLSGKLSYERKVLLITLEGKRTRKEATACLFQVLEKIIQPIEANQGNS